MSIPRIRRQYDDQVTLGLACLFSLPGIPCLYYGTEQGLHGAGSDLAVREALWGGPGFGQNVAYYQHISQIAAVRRESPALRYGRFYFRPIFGDGQQFGASTFLNGTLAFSRILNGSGNCDCRQHRYCQSLHGVHDCGHHAQQSRRSAAHSVQQ